MRAATVLILAVVVASPSLAWSSVAHAESPAPGATDSIVDPGLSTPTAPDPGAPSPTVEPSAGVTPPSMETPPTSETVTPAPTNSSIPSPEPSAGLAPAESRPAAPPATAPALRNSPVTLQSAATAVVVLIASLVLLLRAARRRPVDELAESDTEADARAPSPSRAETTGFLVALGEAMIDAGDPVTDVATTLERVAHRSGIPDAEVVAFATALIVSVPGAGQVSTAVASAGARGLRLDQIDDVFDVVDDALTTDLEPAVALGRLRSIRRAPPPWGIAARVMGYVLMSVGLSLILGASLPEIAVAALLGAVVGALQLTGDGPTSTYRTVLPLVCAFGVSTTVFLLARTTWDIGVFAPLIAPLVAFLPGALLTTAVLELATGQMLSGAGRLAAGLMRLVLLAVGIVAAAQLVGVPTRSVTDLAVQPLGPWAPWIGVAVFGVGVVLHRCARPQATAWILLVLYVAYAGQVIGGLFLGGVLSAFTGAVLMTPVAMLVARHRSGPTTLVSFLPAFWLLVPGALGLVGVAKYIGDDRVYGAASLVTAGETMVAIALGVLIGSSLGAVVATPRTSG
ncbi:MAG: threonine/serine exporter family protein [Cellulomonas sp.]